MSSSSVASEVKFGQDHKELFLAFVPPQLVAQSITSKLQCLKSVLTWSNPFHLILVSLGTQSFPAAKTLVAQLAPLLGASSPVTLRFSSILINDSGALALAVDSSPALNSLQRKIAAVLEPSSETVLPTLHLGQLRTAPEASLVETTSAALAALAPFVVDTLQIVARDPVSGNLGTLHSFSMGVDVQPMDESENTEGLARPSPLSLPSSSSTPAAAPPPLEIGTVLLVRGVHRCELAWAGQIDGRALLGVVHEGPKGNCDGALLRAGSTVRCFTCPPGHGEFVEAGQVAIFDAKVQAAARIQRAFRGHFSRQRRRELINQEVWNLLDQKKENVTLHAREIYARLAEQFRKAGHAEVSASSSLPALPALPSLSMESAHSDDMPTGILTLQYQDSENWSPPLASPGGTRLPPPRLPDGPMALSFVLAMLTHFRAGGLLHGDDVVQLLKRTSRALEQLDNVVVLPLQDKITVCGDIHGQLDDLCFIFNDNGLPSEANPYLFNGDFVDRGQNSCECVLILFAFKLLLPGHFHMNRGNHESQALHRVFGFEEEVVQKYGRETYDLFTTTFARIPIAHVIQEHVFVVHGGPPITQDLATIARMPPHSRFNIEVEDPGFPAGFREMLWNDPQDMPGARPSDRGCGYTWGPDVTAAFLRASGMRLLVRAHEIRPSMFATGYQVHAEHGHRLLTLFSASNYCGRVGNHAAFAVFRSDSAAAATGQQSEMPELVSFMASPKDRETFEPHRAHRNDVIEADIVAQLSSLIADHRTELLSAFQGVDRNRTGTLSRLQTEALLLQALKLPQVPLFLYAEALGLPVAQGRGSDAASGAGATVHYATWLDTFRPVTPLFPLDGEHKQQPDAAPTAGPASASVDAAEPDEAMPPALPVIAQTDASSSEPSTPGSLQRTKSREQDVETAAEFVHKYRSELETLFRRFDRGLTGLVETKAFEDAVSQLNEAEGRPLSSLQVSLLFSAFRKLSPAQRRYDSLFRPVERTPSTHPHVPRPPKPTQLRAPVVARAQSHGSMLPQYAPLAVSNSRPAPGSGSALLVAGRRLPSYFPRLPATDESSVAATPTMPGVRRQLSEPARKVKPEELLRPSSFFQLLSGLALTD